MVPVAVQVGGRIPALEQEPMSVLVVQLPVAAAIALRCSSLPGLELELELVWE